MFTVYLFIANGQLMVWYPHGGHAGVEMFFVFAVVLNMGG